MLSLAHRIATEKPQAPFRRIESRWPGCNPILEKRIQYERKMIAQAVHFRIDNVHNFVARDGIADLHDAPNLAPPFRYMFFEWREVPPERPDWLVQNGMFINATEIRDLPPSAEPVALDFLSGSMMGELDPAGKEAVLSALRESRWMLLCSYWVSSNGAPYHGQPWWGGMMSAIFVSPDGKYRERLIYGAYFGAEDPELMDHVKHVSFTPAIAISFCHCKNVSRTEAVDDRGERWHRRTGAPRLKYYTLNIDPMREVLRREGNSDTVGLKRALHICRGHFATYTEDKPLFGRLTGTFWKPDHVRGTTERGIVAKDYSVSVN